MIHDEGAPCCHVGDVPWVCVGMAGLTCANWFLNTQPVCCPTQPQSPISLTLGQVWMLKPAIIHTHSAACKGKSMSHLVVTGCPSFDLHDYIVVCCILRHTAHPFRGCGKLWIPTGQVGSCMHVLFSASESWCIITHLHTHTHTATQLVVQVTCSACAVSSMLWNGQHVPITTLDSQSALWESAAPMR